MSVCTCAHACAVSDRGGEQADLRGAAWGGALPILPLGALGRLLATRLGPSEATSCARRACRRLPLALRRIKFNTRCGEVTSKTTLIMEEVPRGAAPFAAGAGRVHGPRHRPDEVPACPPWPFCRARPRVPTARRQGGWHPALQCVAASSGWLSVPALALPLLTKMSGQKVRCPWSSGPPFSAWRSRGVARLPTPAACVLRPNSPVLPQLVAREAWRRGGRLGGPERPMATMHEGIPLLLTTLRGRARPPGPGGCLLCRRLLRSNPGCSHLRPHPFMSGLLVPGAQRTARADA